MGQALVKAMLMTATLQRQGQLLSSVGQRRRTRELMQA